jgi:hypothetical protein
MQLEDNDIREFAEIWLEEFGETLSESEARHHASQLLALYELLAQAPAETREERPPAT